MMKTEQNSGTNSAKNLEKDPKSCDCSCKSCPCTGTCPCNNKRLSRVSMALAFGGLWGVYLFTLGILAYEFSVGVFLVKFLGNFYIGYAPGFIGALKGLIFGFIDGFICGFILAVFYNLSLKFKNRVCRACKIGQCCKSCKNCPTN